jgi:sulfur-carrier protein
VLQDVSDHRRWLYLPVMPGTTAAPTISVRVLLFASYADTLGLDSLELEFESAATVADALMRVRSLPGGNRLPPKPLCALNLTHVTQDAPLSGGDELAILPPLAGG